MTNQFFDFTAIERASVKQQPFPFFGIDNALNITCHREILANFPDISSGGSYSLGDITISDTLNELINEIESDKFRALIAKKLDIDLTDKPALITARGNSRLRDGKSHTDSKTKLITVLLYFNDGWEHKTGRLRILNSDNVNDCDTEFSAAIGQLIAFKVTDNCWHGYQPFEGQRQSLQINYLTDAKYSRQHIVRHRVSAFFKKLLKPIASL
jgi:hypothetical protein